MPAIMLSQNKVTIVDEEDFVLLDQWKWYAIKHKRTYYAVRTEYFPKKRRIWMHRLILSPVPDGQSIDHADGNGLNNQRSNLRFANAQQNAFNRMKLPGFTSIYKGVSWSKAYKRWTARIGYHGRDENLGFYRTEREAAIAYNQKAKDLFGAYAKLNPLMEEK